MRLRADTGFSRSFNLRLGLSGGLEGFKEPSAGAIPIQQR
jgi:hypothetical protein